jgi:hypothetical protein
MNYKLGLTMLSRHRAFKRKGSNSNTYGDGEYFLGLQHVASYINKHVITETEFPINKEILYNNYINYCNQYANVPPVTKRMFTTYLTVFLAQEGYRLITTKVPGQGMILNLTPLEIKGLPRC